MVLKLNRKTIKIRWSTVLYLIAILSYFLYLARDLNYNTAFVDEAIYATVGEEINRGIYWENALSWMGGSYVYPTMSAWFNRHWGLYGVRLFSTVCLVITGIVVGQIGKKLGGGKTQFISTGLFLFSANTINLGQLGTYDAPALTLLSLGTYFALIPRYDSRFKKYSSLLLSSVLFAFAVLTKYVMILFLPVIVLLILFRNNRFNLRRSLAWFLVFYLIIFYFAWNNLEQLVDFFTNSHFSEPSTRIRFIKEILTYTGVQVIGISIALPFVIKRVESKKKWLIILLSVAGSIPIAYHLGASNIRSVWKHLVLTSFFWSPVTGWMILKLIKLSSHAAQTKAALANMSQIGWTVMSFAITSFLWFNFSNHWEFQRSWPSATSSIEYFEANRKDDDMIFAEASAVYKYHLFSGFEDPQSWTSTWWLDYEGVQGTEGMKKAIWDRHFDYIILNGYFTNAVNQEIKWDIEQNYVPVFEDSYSVQGQYEYKTVIWKPMKTDNFGQLLEERNDDISLDNRGELN